MFISNPKIFNNNTINNAHQNIFLSLLFRKSITFCRYKLNDVVDSLVFLFSPFSLIADPNYVRMPLFGPRFHCTGTRNNRSILRYHSTPHAKTPSRSHRLNHLEIEAALGRILGAIPIPDMDVSIPSRSGQH